jgi:hypothetical protein
MKIVELFLDDNEESGIEAISIVESPAIESDFIALKSDEIKLAEVDKEKKILMGALLIPNKPIYRKTEGDEYYIYFSRETVLKASQRYLMNGYQGNSTLEHSDNLQGLTLVESWIVEDEVQDKSRKYDMNVPIGTWMGTVKVNNEEVWNNYVKTGKVKGFSIEGFFADKIKASKMNKKMNKEQEADLLLSKITSILKGERVELGLADDFEKKFKKVVDDDSAIGGKLIDDLRKAEVKYSQISKDYQELIKQGEKLESSAKELGIDLPAIIKNKILSSKDGVKEAQKLNESIKKFYSLF